VLTDKPMNRVGAYRMIRRRTAKAGLKGKLGCHVFRATGITPISKRAVRSKAHRPWPRMKARAPPSSTTVLAMRLRSTRWSGLPFEIGCLAVLTIFGKTDVVLLAKLGCASRCNNVQICDVCSFFGEFRNPPAGGDVETAKFLAFIL
jgi:hypothetical protein